MKFCEAAITAVETIRVDPTSQEAQAALDLLDILARFMLEPPTLQEVRARYKVVKIGLPSEAQASLAAQCEALVPIDTLKKRYALLEVIRGYE